MAFDPAAPRPEAPAPGQGTAEDFNYDVLLGDFLDEEQIGQRRFFARPDETGIRGEDRFILGDWRTPYYLDDGFIGSQQVAIVADFQTDLDTLQLHGSPEDYTIVNFPFVLPNSDGENRFFTGFGLFYQGVDPTTNAEAFDLIAYFPNVRPFQTDINIFGGLQAPTDFDLEADYIKYVGPTPPPGPAESGIKQLGTIGVDAAYGISVDPEGNVYAVGATTGTLGDTNEGSFDVWVAKYDSFGNELWLRQFGTSHPDLAWDIETFTAENGEVNFYLVGSTTGVISDALGGSENNDGYQDIWLGRFDSEGNPVLDNEGDPVFVRQNTQVPPLTGTEIDNSLQIDVDSDGNLYQSAVTVELEEFSEGEFAPQDFAWVASYDQQGNFRWSNFDSLDVPGVFDESYGIAVASDGTTFATGFSQLGIAGEENFVGVYDAWVSRFDENGEQIFLEQFGSVNYDFAWGIDTDSQDNAYISGLTAGDILGPDGEPVASNAGFNDVFLAKYTKDGTFAWVKQFGTEGDDGQFLGDIVVDAFDNIFVTGFTDSNLGGPNQGGYDSWVASFDTDGNQNWITQFGSSELDMPTALDVDNFGSIYVTGFTEGSLGAGNEGATDAWIAKLDASTGNLLNFAPPKVDPQRLIEVTAGEHVTVDNFGGVGRGAKPDAETIAELDTLSFLGSGLTAENLQLTQNGDDLEITFLDDETGTKVILTAFDLDHLDNLRKKTGGNIDRGNILFSDESGFEDSFDVFNADSTQEHLWNRNSVTFLNDLDNHLTAFSHSNDLVNALGGDDFIDGLSGDDTLRGGAGNDTLVGNHGEDVLTGGDGEDTFVLTKGTGVDEITDFEVGIDRIALGSGLSLAVVELLETAGNTLVKTTQDEQLAVISGVTGLDNSIFV
ncbi:MAG: hypothetical protein F6K00_07940 [Leptolyngbya sp. SIOISBB]|nr:hypothetical protein [Leptolyngbya sp. SIOISBB]